MSPRALLILLGFFLTAPFASAQSRPASKPAPAPGTPAAEVAAVLKEFDAAEEAFDKLYQAAKTKEEKEKLFEEKYPKAEQWSPKLLEIATAHPKDPAALEALQWVVQRDGDSDRGGQALEVLARDHLADPGLVEITDGLGYSVRPEAESLLRAAMRESPDPVVRARATYSLAQVLRRVGGIAKRLNDPSDEEDRKNLHKWVGEAGCKRLAALDADKVAAEAESILLTVKDKYADVKASYRGTLGERAEADLFELRNLAIGKVAPEIVGEDVDGKPLRLSDFRGKVVVLDFWGFW
jgi:hypothetical protein